MGELLIFLFLKFQEVYSRLNQQTETQLLEVRISIYAFNSSSLLNSSPNMVWISQVINLHSKESEKPLRRQRLNFHLLLRLMLILHIFQLITPDLNIFNSVSRNSLERPQIKVSTQMKPSPSVLLFKVPFLPVMLRMCFFLMLHHFHLVLRPWEESSPD